jgi:hypothetical protein
MTLLDAPAFDTVRDRRNRRIIFITVGALGVLTLAWWMAAGLPIDWPWTWNNHWRGTVAVDRFFKAVEANDLPKAYGIWVHDKNWQQRSGVTRDYTFARFQEDWSPNGQGNDYGAIKSHSLTAARMYGNVLVVGVYINGRKSKAMFLSYDTKDHTLGFSPVELYLGP